MTIGRIFSNTFAGIAPTSVPGFVLAQMVGAGLGAGLVLALYPDVGRSASAVIVAHETNQHNDRDTVSSDPVQSSGQRRQSCPAPGTATPCPSTRSSP